MLARAPSEHTTVVLDSLEDDAVLIHGITARRVRDIGGPLDEASYSCDCGYVFAASVSTSVCCPHCGATQAW